MKSQDTLNKQWAGRKRHCPWCNRYYVDGAWVPLAEEPDRRAVMVTDGICPECEEQYEAKLEIQDRERQYEEYDMIARKEIR